MKNAFKHLLFLSALTFGITEDAPAAAEAPQVDIPTPSIGDRLASLFERFGEKVEGALHSALDKIEELFAEDDGDVEIETDDADPTPVAEAGNVSQPAQDAGAADAGSHTDTPASAGDAPAA